MVKARKNDKKSVSCSVESTLDAVGGRWKVLVIFHLLEGPRRFGDLSRLLKGVTPRTLTRQLRELEASGIIRREVFPHVPPMVEYSLTPAGEALKPVLLAMDSWGERFGESERKDAPPKKVR